MVAPEPFQPQPEPGRQAVDESRTDVDPRATDEDEPILLREISFSSGFRPHLDDPE